MDAQEKGFIKDKTPYEKIHAKLCNDAAYSVEIASLVLQRKFNISRIHKGIEESELATQTEDTIEKIWAGALKSY